MPLVSEHELYRLTNEVAACIADGFSFTALWRPTVCVEGSCRRLVCCGIRRYWSSCSATTAEAVATAETSSVFLSADCQFAGVFPERCLAVSCGALPAECTLPTYNVGRTPPLAGSQNEVEHNLVHKQDLRRLSLLRRTDEQNSR